MPTSLDAAVAAVRKHAPQFFPKMGIILGSGLSSLAEHISNPISVPYQAIPGLTAGTVSGHSSMLVMGHLNDIPIICMRGRLHFYEGVPVDAIRIFVRLIKYLGASALVVSAAAGSLRTEVGAGSLMMITDHINFQPLNPLVGANDESIGPRFVSLENAYDPGLNQCLVNAAQRLGIPLSSGVYLSVLGPSFETPAEIRMFKMLGADAVGMSVVPEVILARHCGLKVVGIAGITNLAVGLSTQKVTHDVTLQNGEIVARNLAKLVPAFLKEAVQVI